MDLAEFAVGDEQFEVTHNLLVDRLRFLPNNTIEGEQVILVRAISGDESSTNLAVGIHVMGEEKMAESGGAGSLMGLIVGMLALLVLALLGALAFAGVQLRERGYFDDDEEYDQEMDEYDQEMDAAVESMMSGEEDAADDGD